MSFTRATRKALRQTRSSKVTVVDPWLIGDTAKHDGKSESDNPYPIDTEDSIDWLKGYREANI
jgi:ribosome modulation factor